MTYAMISAGVALMSILVATIVSASGDFNDDHH